MAEINGAMTGAEFMVKAMTEPNPDPDAVGWAVSAATSIMMIATQPQQFDKDILVEAMQNLALRMPPELVRAGTMNWKDIEAEVG